MDDHQDPLGMEIDFLGCLAFSSSPKELILYAAAVLF
jgi:hypothetical protein